MVTISKIALVPYKATPNAIDRQTAAWSCHGGAGNETNANVTIHLVPNIRRRSAATERVISASAGSKRLTLPHHSTAPTVDSEDKGSVKNPRRPDSLYPLPTNDDSHHLSKRSNKALLSVLYPRLMGTRQWAELNARP